MTPRPHGLIRQARQHTQPWMLRSAAVALTVTLLAASAPLLWSAVAGGLSLLVLVGLALVGAAVFQALPWAFQRLENQLLRWRKAKIRWPIGWPCCPTTKSPNATAAFWKP